MEYLNNFCGVCFDKELVVELDTEQGHPPWGWWELLCGISLSCFISSWAWMTLCWAVYEIVIIKTT